MANRVGRGYDARSVFHYRFIAMKKVQMSDSKLVAESEDQLVSRAQEAVSQSRWVVGECAAKWTERYARGRTDADFAGLIGVSADQVYQRRRVWETFAGIRDDFSALKWSHFYAVLTWDDAVDCLRWAAETGSTVAEMRAWRRAQRGEDLTVDPLEEESVQFVPSQPEVVYVPGESGTGGARGEAVAERVAGEDQRAVLAGVARQGGSNGDDYSPFRSGAALPPPREQPAESIGGAGGTGEPPSTEQLVKRLTHTLERFVKLMTPEFRREFRNLSEPVKKRFHSSLEELAAHVAELK